MISRYKYTPLYDRGGTLTYKNREKFKISLEGATTHLYSLGDRLDKLAYEYYGDETLWWVFLECNKLRTECDIKIGDTLIIPSYNEVMKCLMK